MTVQATFEGVQEVFFFPIGNYTSGKILAMAEQGVGPRTALLANDRSIVVPTSVPERLGTVLTRPWSLL
jgi:hypothetical protein